MSVQANPLVYLIVNALVPWSLTGTYFLERRRKRIAYTFPQCLEELSELEALASLVIFDHYQTDVYPEVKDAVRRPPLAFKLLFHPLIDRERVVPNDFHFPAGKNLGLLTGSNMSGKSTFLRTIGVNQILANIGAPVFAENFETSPLAIETCIEVSDSLRDGFSYFYAEVRRLKALLETSKHDQAMLYLIDEIFRGTNNRERHIGSRAVIRTLATSPHSIGFISTHDLELTALENSSPTVLNLHFREEISPQGEMLFTYLLRHGPCPTTNALKIMAAEGIEVDDP
jgi:DNA mismatch repair ATPase MutS